MASGTPVLRPQPTCSQLCSALGTVGKAESLVRCWGYANGTASLGSHWEVPLKTKIRFTGSPSNHIFQRN